MREKIPRCPICKNPMPEKPTWFPFCSERCKLKDLGAWASGNYAIPGDTTAPAEPDDDTSGQLPDKDE